jgi:hypothetical protein
LPGVVNFSHMPPSASTPSTNARSILVSRITTLAR